jgi:hypothetical protein
LHVPEPRWGPKKWQRHEREFLEEMATVAAFRSAPGYESQMECRVVGPGRVSTKEDIPRGRAFQHLSTRRGFGNFHLASFMPFYRLFQNLED